MEWDTYVEECRRSDSTATRMGRIDAAGAAASRISELHYTMGIATEAGELLDAYKKAIFYRKPIYRGHLVEELGDLLWYVARLMDELGVSMDEVLAANVKKLRARYPDGFSERAAVERADVAAGLGGLDQSTG